MARPLRIEYPDAWYHVMNRGRRGEVVFSGKKDFFVFLDLLKESSEMWRVKVAAYCLMSNHYHLLIQTPEANLSRFMRHLNGVYTQRYNRRHKVDGQLFRGRYKSILVDGDSYLLELMRYIHRNPLRAGIVKNINEYPWNSHHGYVSRAKKWQWLDKDFLLSMFSEKQGLAKKLYLDFVSLGASEEIKQFFARRNVPSVIGSEDFINWAKEKFYTKKSHPQVPEAKQLAPSIDTIKEAVCRAYNIDHEDMRKARRGVINEPRNVALYLARRYCGESLIKIGHAFNLSNYSSVSSVVTRVIKGLENDKKLRKRIEKIVKNL